jgi:MerR family transcriptional regulator, light-induced transcriptional regulator
VNGGPNDVLTLQQAADLLGVHYMTAYRYVRLGLLSAEKARGVWQVSVGALEEFRAGPPSGGRRSTVAAGGAGAAGGTGGTDGASGGGAVAAGGRRRRAPWAERLEARLIAGDARGAWGVVEAALSAGADLDEIYLDVLAPAMSSIGERWERGELDVSVEHRASGIAMRLTGRLGPRFARRGRTRGVVVLGAPAGERHSLPIALVSDLLRQQGWDVSDLGADVPDESFVHAVLNTRDVAAVGVSVTIDACLESARHAIAALHAASDVTVVVGGRAVTSDSVGRSLGADLVALGAREFAGVLDQVRTGLIGARIDTGG